MKRFLIAGLAACLVFSGIVWVKMERRRARQAQQAAWQQSLLATRRAELERERRKAERASEFSSAGPELSLPPASALEIPRGKTADVSTGAVRTAAAPPRAATKASQPLAQPPRGKPEPQDPLARVALNFVGADPEAEAYWVAAINDPSLPAEERKDLIEDLNEDGFPDPKHITLDDLPLILSRLSLIEAYAGDAIDEVNAAAFQEAYKDLVNMAARLAQQ